MFSVRAGGDAFEHDLAPLGSCALIPASHCSERVVTRLVFAAATDLDNLVARLSAVLAAKLLILRHLTLTVIVRTLGHAGSPSAESTFAVVALKTHTILRNWSLPATLDPMSDFNQAHDGLIHSRRPRAVVPGIGPSRAARWVK